MPGARSTDGLSTGVFDGRGSGLIASRRPVSHPVHHDPTRPVGQSEPSAHFAEGPAAAVAAVVVADPANPAAGRHDRRVHSATGALSVKSAYTMPSRSTIAPGISRSGDWNIGPSETIV